MPNIKISALPQVTSVQPSDIGPVVATGVTSKITIQDLANSLTTVSSSISASYAVSASYLINYIPPFPFTGSAQITGSLGVTGSFSTDRDARINSLTVGRGGGNIGTNTAFGSGSLISNTTGNRNTAIGNRALGNNTTGYKNAAIGTYALLCNTFGFCNTAIGYSALRTNSIGFSNTAIGNDALRDNTAGCFNTAIGNFALCANTSGCRNTAIGAYALRFNNTGLFNAAIGISALRYNTSGCRNTAIGYAALYCNTTGCAQVAIGTEALRNSKFTATSANANVAVGYKALCVNTIGTSNTAIGTRALENNTTGASNTAIGFASMLCNTSGNVNTAVGVNSLRYNNIGRRNTAVGYGALRTNNSGCNNTALGYCGLFSNNTGCSNTAIGVCSLRVNSSGGNNIAIGFVSMCTNTYGCDNIAIGNSTLRTNTTGRSNVAIGSYAARFNTTGGCNVAVGRAALIDNNTGIRNVAIGYQAGCLFKGSNNVILGGYTGSAQTCAENNNILLSDGEGNLRLFVTGSDGLATFFGTGGVSASAFTGSFTGTLSGTASWANNAVTASYVLQAVSASFATIAATASTADNFYVRQDVTASNALFTGTITAQKLSVQYITASTEFVTGSTKFGSQLTDTHQFTGSVSITGSLLLNGTQVPAGSNSTGNVTVWKDSSTITGSNNLYWDLTNSRLGIGTTTPLYRLHVKGDYTLIGQYNLALGASLPSSSVDGGVAVAWNRSGGGAETDFINLYENAFTGFEFSQKTGSNATRILYRLGSSYHSFYTNDIVRAQIDNSGNFGIGTSPDGNYILQVKGGFSLIGQHNTSNPASSSAQGGVAFSWNRSGGRAETNITNVYDNSVTSFEFLQKTGANTVNRLYQIQSTQHSFYVGDSIRMIVFESGSQVTGSLNVSGGITGSLFGTASYAITASYSLNAANLTTYQLATGSVTASLNVNSASFQLVSGSTNLLFVSNSGLITAQRLFLSSSRNMSSGSTLVVFGSGSAQPVFTVQGSQGELFSVNDSLSGSLFSVNDISGLPIIEAFSDNRVLIGSYQAPMLTTTVRTTLAAGNNIIYQNIPTASYDAVFFEYSLKSGSNARAGSIMGIWSGSDANYNEVVTTDFGDTTGVKFMVMVTGSNVALTGSATTANWTMKTIVRGI